GRLVERDALLEDERGCTLSQPALLGHEPHPRQQREEREEDARERGAEPRRLATEATSRDQGDAEQPDAQQEARRQRALANAPHHRAREVRVACELGLALAGGARGREGLLGGGQAGLDALVARAQQEGALEMEDGTWEVAEACVA